MQQQQQQHQHQHQHQQKANALSVSHNIIYAHRMHSANGSGRTM
jgi:hypothetical protein